MDILAQELCHLTIFAAINFYLHLYLSVVILVKIEIAYHNGLPIYRHVSELCWCILVYRRNVGFVRIARVRLGAVFGKLGSKPSFADI